MSDASWLILTIVLGGVATLAIYSFLVKENAFYRFFEHLFIGIGVGLGVVQTIKLFLWPKGIEPIWTIVRETFASLASDERTVPLLALLYLIPMAFGCLYYFIYSKKHGWLARLVIMFSLGAYAGMTCKGFFAEYTPQIIGSFKPVVVQEQKLRESDIGDWQRFSQTLREEGAAEAATPAKRVWALLNAGARSAAGVLAAGTDKPEVLAEARVTLAFALNLALKNPGMFRAEDLSGVPLPAEATALRKRVDAHNQYTQARDKFRVTRGEFDSAWADYRQALAQYEERKAAGRSLPATPPKPPDAKEPDKPDKAGVTLITSYDVQQMNRLILAAAFPSAVESAGWIDWFKSFSNLVFIVTLLCVMTYFFFSFEHNRPVIREASYLGRWLMMVCFGAFFGSTVMARMALLVERLQFLINKWIYVLIYWQPPGT